MNKKEIINKINDEISFIRRCYVKKYELNNKVLSFSLAFSLALTNSCNMLLRQNRKECFSSADSVYEYVEKNPYLDDNEKESLYYVEGFINDYYYLLDAEVLKHRLQVFDIDYKDLDSNIYGSWKSNIDVVNLYCCDNSLDIKKNKSTISHELYHVLSVNNDKEYSECLSEGITSLLNYEYSDFNNSDLYIKERQIARLLTILVGKENMIDSYLNFDIYKLKSNLKKISTNKEKLKDLFDSIEEYHKLNIESFSYINKTLDSETYKEYKKNYKKKYELSIKIAADLNYYAKSKKLEFNDDFYIALNSFVNENDEVMEIDSNYYVYLDDSDIKMYTINNNSNKEKVLVK